ncbi:hypothetical protein L1887_50168 [Cichorium endivia]|nr:hypothetical protein L1887_50168 [Cichorium endivia]
MDGLGGKVAKVVEDVLEALSEADERFCLDEERSARGLVLEGCGTDVGAEVLYEAEKAVDGGAKLVLDLLDELDVSLVHGGAHCVRRHLLAEFAVGVFERVRVGGVIETLGKGRPWRGHALVYRWPFGVFFLFEVEAEAAPNTHRRQRVGQPDWRARWCECGGGARAGAGAGA